MNHSDDLGRALVQRLKSDDKSTAEEAMQEISTLHLPSIASALRGRFPTFGPHDWEDVSQSVLNRLWHLRAELDESRFTRGYLYLALRNAAISRVRKEQKHRAAFGRLRPEELESLNASTVHSSHHSTVHDPSAKEIVRQLMSLLSREDRRIVEIFVHSDGEDGWVRSAATELGLSEGNVRVRKLRALRRLKTLALSRGYVVEGVE